MRFNWFGIKRSSREKNMTTPDTENNEPKRRSHQMKITFHTVKVPSLNDPTGDIFLLLDTPWPRLSQLHVDAMLAINEFAGGEVVQINGRGIGVNLKIVDKDLWSDNVSRYVDEIPGTGRFELLLP